MLQDQYAAIYTIVCKLKAPGKPWSETVERSLVQIETGVGQELDVRQIVHLLGEQTHAWVVVSVFIYCCVEGEWWKGSLFDSVYVDIRGILPKLNTPSQCMVAPFVSKQEFQ
jgi:hypothetical protein